MYHYSEKNIHVEIGVANNKNKEHRGNLHIYVEGFGHIRGITVYKKEKNGSQYWLLRMPGYKKTKEEKYETAYILLDDNVAEIVYNALNKIEQKKFVKYYSGPQTWSIWKSNEEQVQKKVISKDKEDDVYSARNEMLSDEMF